MESIFILCRIPLTIPGRLRDDLGTDQTIELIKVKSVFPKEIADPEI